MRTTINIIITSIILLMIACKSKSNKTVSVDAPPCTIIQAPMDGDFTSLPYATNFVYYNWYKVKTDVCRVNPFLLKDNFEIAIKKGEGSDIINNDPNRGYNFGTREGEFKNGKQHGLWQCQRNYYLDSLGYNIYKKYKFREEYFKNGLRDSIYKIYNKKGDIIYSTYFKNGTGLEKDFHENGKLYYEIQTKDGYFIDTLRLYNDNGNLVEKLLYKKDSLVYHKRITCN